MSNWHTVWQAEGYPLSVEAQTVNGTNGEYQLHRIQHGALNNSGAAIIAQNSAGKLLLVSQMRKAVEHVLWEFPRGVGDETDPNPVATAVRELKEETGFTGKNGVLLGAIYPDSGLLATKVHVVKVEVSDQKSEITDGEVDAQQWVAESNIKQLIADGSLCDGISLAAWALLQSQK